MDGRSGAAITSTTEIFLQYLSQTFRHLLLRHHPRGGQVLSEKAESTINMFLLPLRAVCLSN